MLLIEDDPVCLEQLGGLLRDAGYAVIAAIDGDSGLAATLEHQPDLVVSGLNMPGGIDGLEVARRVRLNTRLAALPLVAVTASHLPTSCEEALAAGFDACLGKPVDPATLMGLVRASLQPSLSASQQPAL